MSHFRLKVFQQHSLNVNHHGPKPIEDASESLFTLMSTAPMRLKFDFITERGGQRLKDRDVTTQHIIRKRATQAAAATKKREGRNARVNVIQYPSWITAGDPTTSQNPDKDVHQGISWKAQIRAKGHSHRKKARSVAVASDVDCSSSSTSSSCQQALPHLRYYSPSPILSADQLVSLLPSLRLQEVLLSQRHSQNGNARESNKTRKLLRLTNSDFVSLVVDRYGQSKALDAAIDCLAARTRQLMGDSLQLTCKSDSPAFLYGRALRYMKQDIDNIAVQLPNVSTKLAILVLALYELLNTADQMAWILHSNGAAILLQKAGPKAMDDELKKKLLTICTPVIGTEALLSGSDCFLAQPEWQQVIQDTIIPTAETFDDRGELLISLRMLFVYIPNLFNEVTTIVLDGIVSDMFYLRARLQQVRSQFSHWRIRWDHQVHRIFSDLESEDMRLYALTVSLVGSALVDRLLLSINPELMELEQSALYLSKEAIEATRFTTLPVRDARIRVGFMVGIAESIVATSWDWEMALYGADSGATIAPNVFSGWCRLLGRPV